MSSLPLLTLLLIFCLSLHACTSRPLILSHKETAKFLSYKDFEEVLFVIEKFIHASHPRPCTPEENEEHKVKVLHDEIIICESGCHLSTLREIQIGHYSNRHSATTTSFQTDSPSLLLGQMRHTRSMLGPAQHHVKETMNPSSGDNTLDDLVVMDYAQPHRKPPIHNEKP